MEKKSADFHERALCGNLRPSLFVRLDGIRSELAVLASYLELPAAWTLGFYASRFGSDRFVESLLVTPKLRRRAKTG